LFFRFIPAGAGNTSVLVFGFSCRAVYPRWRGEHIWSLVKLPICAGLSPLARGTHLFVGESVNLARGTPVQRLFKLSDVRFIPAGAGNTLKNPSLIGFPTVYPRWRGEHF